MIIVYKFLAAVIEGPRADAATEAPPNGSGNPPLITFNWEYLEGLFV